MKTIVINTSKEAAETKLDVLFKTPCDRNSLLWFETELADIQDMPPVIRQALIDNVDIVDRDYNLIVLVDLCSLPHGNDSNYVNIYKPLLARYIGMKLVCPLHSNQGITPKATSLYFADSSTPGEWYDYAAFQDINAEEQQKRKNREALEAEAALQAAVNSRDGEGGLVDVYDAVDQKQSKQTIYSQNDKIIMDIFGWTENITKDEISWQLPLSVGERKDLDYTDVFALETTAISCRSDRVAVIDSALEVIRNVISNTKNSGYDQFLSRLPDGAPIEYVINCLSHNFARDNERAVIEGFFNLLANIFDCVQTGSLDLEFKLYSFENIKDLLLSALKKYKYFSIEENVTVEFEPVAKIYEKKERIFSLRNDAKNIITGNNNKTPDDIAKEIMSKRTAYTQTVHTKLRGVDAEFQSLVTAVFNNYDPELIREQNSEIVKQCLTELWELRDKQTGEGFSRIVDSVLGADSDKSTRNVRETIVFIEADYERDYSALINRVTETEHSLSSNKNILLETKDLVLKYGDLMRKGKVYLISSIGAFISMAVAVLPYLYVEYYGGTNPFTFAAMGPIVVAGAFALYGTAASVYASRIASKKRALKGQLEDIKKKSESERKESIKALYQYYSKTVVDAENHYLLWREISRRDRENAKKGIKRNNHIKQLEFLIGEIRRFMTMLKIEVSEEACAVTDDDKARYKSEKLSLYAEESFHSPKNQKIYSVIPVKTHDKENKEGGEE